jgi:hypothetical protein
MSRPGDAVCEMRRVLDSARSAFGEGVNSHTLKLEATLARTLLETGSELEEAEIVARHAAQGLAPEIGRYDLNTVFATDTLNCVIRARGRTSEAAQLAGELLRDVTSIGISDSSVLCALHQTNGECALDAGDIDRAASELKDAWCIAEDGGAYAGDPIHPRRLALMADLAQVEDARGRAQEAAAWRVLLADSAQAR